jgi:hypothetical protein
LPLVRNPISGIFLLVANSRIHCTGTDTGTGTNNIKNGKGCCIDGGDMSGKQIEVPVKRGHSL